MQLFISFVVDFEGRAKWGATFARDGDDGKKQLSKMDGIICV